MTFRPSYSHLLVALQLTSAGLLLATGPLLASFWPLILVQIGGLTIGIWAILIMKSANKFNIPPTVRKGSKLVKRSIYKYVRHPMYSAVLLYFLPGLITDFSWLRLGCFGVLVGTLVFKMNYEEKLLSQAFSDYPAYQKQSWHLFPYLY